MRIIGIYYPANPNTPKQTIDFKIKQYIAEASGNNWHTIIAGDFNAVSNLTLDKFSTIKNFQKQKPSNHLLQHLNNLGFLDSFQELNPRKKDFTWKNSQHSSSHLDQIWLSPSHTWNLTEAYIDEDTNPTIPTDHKPCICKIEAWQLELTELTSLQYPNFRFNWSNASEDNWKDFSQYIENYLTNISLTPQHPQLRWNKLSDIILKSAHKHIQKIKQHHKSRDPVNRDYTPKKIILLQRLIQKSKQHIQGANAEEYHNTLLPIYNKALTVFPDLPKIPDNHLNNQNLFISWLSEIQNLLLKYKSALQIITNFKQKQQMKNFINRRFEFLTHNKKKMIQSILNKPTHSIILNKLIIHQPYTQIIINPSTISHLVCQHYQQWTRRRNTQPLSDFPKWKLEYELLLRIDPNWFTSTLSSFLLEEIIQVIKSRHNSSASELS